MNQIVTAGAAQTLQAFVAAAGDRTELRSWNFCDSNPQFPHRPCLHPRSAIRAPGAARSVPGSGQHLLTILTNQAL